MAKRPLSARHRDWLHNELPVWQAAGAISNEQSAQILGLYESATESTARRASGAVFTLKSLAPLLAGMAALLAVGFNWAALSASVKLSLVFGGMLAAYAVGFWLRYRGGLPLASEVAFLLGCLLYGVGIWQIAQVFHVESHYPDGIWLWALGTLPIAMCLDSPLVHVLYAALLALWVGTEALDYGRFGYWLFGIRRWDVPPNAAYSLPLLALPGVLWAYRKQSPLTAHLYALVLTWWVVLQPVVWGHSPIVVYAIGTAAGLLLLASQAHRPRSPMAVPYRTWGVLIAAGVLLPLSSASFQYELLHVVQPASALPVAAILTVVALATTLLVSWVRSIVDPQWSRVGESLLAGLRRQWLPAALIGLMIGLCLWSWACGAPGPRYVNYMQRSALLLTPEVLAPTLACNAAILVLCVWLLRLGVSEDRGRPFVGGVLLFLAWAVVRYVDLFGVGGGMLGAAAMFLVCGAILFIVARFWRGRLAKRIEVTHD